MSVADALRSAIRAAAGLVDPAPLEDALRLLLEPPVLAVVGRVAAGKSTLVGWLSGAPRRTGLGGVTQVLERVSSAVGVLLDTPGIDDPDAAMLGLDSVLEDADGAIWVVDGLQPLTASERDVLAATLPPGRPLWIVVSKADLLDPAEVPVVVARVRDLSSAHAPLQIRALDLRTAARAGADPQGLGVLSGIGPRRAGRVRGAIDEVRGALAAVPVPPGPEELRASWRSAVRAAVVAVEQELASGAVTDRYAALHVLCERAPEALAAVRRAASPAPPPPLPLPSTPVADARSMVLAGLTGGLEGARRALKAEAARWLAEGELALAEPWPGSEVLAIARARRAKLARALDASTEAVG
jgi:GTP-binding protein EngB required for normal cell division